jgi:hypothetical protein
MQSNMHYISAQAVLVSLFLSAAALPVEAYSASTLLQSAILQRWRRWTSRSKHGTRGAISSEGSARLHPPLAMGVVLSLKDRNGEPERGGVNGSRWKFYSRIRPMNPNSLVHLRKLLLPSSRSHWGATEPRNKTRTTASTHTQRKLTRQGCW